MPLTPLLGSGSPEPAWIVGPVTWDEVRAADRPDVAERIPGGTALYTARASDALGVRAHLLVLGGADADLDALSGHEVCLVASETLTFRHDFPAGKRQQTLLRAPGRTVAPGDAPAAWPAPATLILAPLLAEDIDIAAFIDEYPTAEVGLLAQGLQRAVLPDQRIAHRAQPASALLDAARPNVSIFLSEEETALWAAGALDYLVARCARVVVTRGADGARVLTRRGEQVIAPAPANVVDATGAGDVFGAAFILAMRAGEEFAGRVAAACAAAACEVRGPGVLPSLGALESELEARSHVDPADAGPGDAPADGGRPA